MKQILIILLLFINVHVYSQHIDTVCINDIKYELCIDTITYDIVYCTEISKSSFIDNIYLGFDIMPLEGNIEPKLLYDITDYSKIGIGYDLGHKTISIGAYISISKASKRKSNIKPIYF